MQTDSSEPARTRKPNPAPAKTHKGRRERVADVTGRIDLRRRQLRRVRLRRAGVIALVLVLVGATGWLFGFSSVFAARKTSISGSVIVTSDAVAAVAGVPLGSPLATIDPGPIARRVAALPSVASVTVTRQWPDTVAIKVTERVAAFAVLSPVGEYWLTDASGVIFQTLPVNPKGMLVAQPGSVDVRLLKDIATVSGALPSALRNRVGRVLAPTPDSISLNLNAGVQVIWGSADQSELKGQVAAALLKTNARVIDVSAPTAPVTR